MTPFSSVVPGTISSMKPFAPGFSSVPNGQCSTLRILDADTYDAIEFVAEMFGGIGADIWYRRDEPVCGVGCADFAGMMGVFESARENGLPTEGESDAAVRAINRRLGVKDQFARVPFALWRQELCIVRGPQPEPSPDATWPTQQKASKRCRDEAPTSPNASI